MAVKEMQNRTTNWTIDLHVENQLVCSTLNEKYFQRVEQSPIEIQGKKAMLCPQSCKLSKGVLYLDCPHSLHTNTSPIVCPSITLIIVDVLDVSQPILIQFSKHIQYNSSKPYSSFKVIG
jgi:hypothetical protein